MAMESKKSENKSWQAVSVWISIFWEVLPQYKIENLSSPNLTFPFDYNLLILQVDEEVKVVQPLS